jgi:hypothetical protein
VDEEIRKGASFQQEKETTAASLEGAKKNHADREQNCHQEPAAAEAVGSVTQAHEEKRPQYRRASK